MSVGARLPPFTQTPIEKADAVTSPRGACAPQGEALQLAKLEHAFFHVIDVEEELHFAWRFTKLRDVLLEIFLHLFG
jgi:hypothetical protein